MRQNKTPQKTDNQKKQETNTKNQEPNVTFFVRKIPSWRLHVDDMTPEEVLTRSPKEYKMPSKSYREWKNYYENSPHEREKMREFYEKKKKLIKEVFGSGWLLREKRNR